MADVAKECRLSAIGFCKGFRALSYFLPRTGVGDCRSHLAGDTVAEELVAIVELQTGTDSEHEEAGQFVRNAGGNGAYNCGPWRIGPGSGRKL